MTNNTSGAKTCQYGHYWYIGATCPLCDYFGRDNLDEAYRVQED